LTSYSATARIEADHGACTQTDCFVPSLSKDLAANNSFDSPSNSSLLCKSVHDPSSFALFCWAASTYPKSHLLIFDLKRALCRDVSSSVV